MIFLKSKVFIPVVMILAAVIGIFVGSNQVKKQRELDKDKINVSSNNGVSVNSGDSINSGDENISGDNIISGDNLISNNSRRWNWK